MRLKFAGLIIALASASVVAGCSLSATPVPAVATPTAGFDTPWGTRVLGVITPLADRRLSRDGSRRITAGLPLLASGFAALGRATGAARYARAATDADIISDGASQGAWPEDVCSGGRCAADDLLKASALWSTGPGSTGVTALDPAFRRMAGALFDREALLFHADDETGVDPSFDSALNARAFAALTRMIEALPTDAPARLEYVALYREMARAVTRLQGTDGFWRETLGDEAGQIDRPASVLFVFGLTWGLNTGMLSFNEGEAAALKGWDAVREPASLAVLQAGDESLGALMMAGVQMAERRW